MCECATHMRRYTGVYFFRSRFWYFTTRITRKPGLFFLNAPLILAIGQWNTQIPLEVSEKPNYHWMSKKREIVYLKYKITAWNWKKSRLNRCELLTTLVARFFFFALKTLHFEDPTWFPDIAESKLLLNKPGVNRNMKMQTPKGRARSRVAKQKVQQEKCTPKGSSTKKKRKSSSS